MTTARSLGGDVDDGNRLYMILGLNRQASQQDVKKAYRSLARTLHPDKGGNAAAFAALQAAFETLHDPKARAAYDSLAADLRFRPGVAAPYSTSNPQVPPGGPPAPPPGVAEAVLLSQLLQRGAAHPCAVFDPHRQLCVTCELCRRPATQQCWTCKMDICDFCTRRQHWKGAVSLHWPLVNQPGSMLEQLGKRELELKRQEDGQAYKEAQPDYRPQAELHLLREFQDSIIALLAEQQQELLQQRKPTAPAAALVQHSHSQARHSPVSGAAANLLSGLGSRVHSVVTASGSTGAVSNPGMHGGSRQLHSGSAPAHKQQQVQQQQQEQQRLTAFALPAAGALLPRGNSARQSSSTVAIGSAVGIIGSSSSSRSSKASAGALVSTQASGPLAVRSSSKATNKCWAAWQQAPEEVKQSLQGRYDSRLGRFYMWTQTECAIILALFLPTGGGKTPPQLTLQPSATGLLVQHDGFAPVLDRVWSQPIDTAAGASSWVCEGGRMAVLKVVKAKLGAVWGSCFKGDPHMARHLQMPYRLLQLPSEVQLELPVPFWVHPQEDVTVSIGPRALTVGVDGVMTLRRTYRWDAGCAAKQGSSYKVVDAAASSWCLLGQKNQVTPPVSPAGAAAPAAHASRSSSSSGSKADDSSITADIAGRLRRPRLVSRADQVLSITLVLPEPTAEEVMYKKGVRQNNASAVRSCPHGAGKTGLSFFQEDEDEWGLQALLQAVLFHETGRTWISPKPWELAAGAGSLLGDTSSSSKRESHSSSTNDSSSNSSTGFRAAGAMWGVGPGKASASSGRWVAEEQLLPEDVIGHLRWLRAAAGPGSDARLFLPSKAQAGVEE